ncbi:MAG: pilus assembly PilX N-terminal domain-containing protein [Cocleimonas sp.]|nr:pilus assembly PilX N-terminal domain-containing protein [Cocleimonas sp.]
MISKYNKNKQTGATLITSLVFLLLMTIVSVSATKISLLDVLVSSNEQQQMVLFQTTANQLKQLTHIAKLNQTFESTGFVGNVSGEDDQYKFTSDFNTDNNITEIITELPVKNYDCERNGVAGSMGPSAPKCDLYDFQVRRAGQNSAAKDRHHHGAGKMVPSGGSKGNLIKN